MATLRTAGIIRLFESFPDSFRGYFNHFPRLAKEFPWDVSIGYLFSQTELAQNMTIYGAVVRTHRVDATIARSVIDSHHMTRDRFRELYEIILDKQIDGDTVAKAKVAEAVRDRILHGKSVPESDKRKAVVSILEYANLLNEQVNSDAGFRPFGSMQGFKGRAASLDKSTSRWVLTGMGLIGRT